MKKIILVTLAMFGLSLLMPIKTFADGSNCVETTIIGGGEVCDDDGSSVIEILKLVANIMSVGVGILGVVGITIVGIQYLTAGGNEEKTRTAKRRIFEIVIGLAVYAAAYAILYWLLPDYTGI